MALLTEATTHTTHSAAVAAARIYRDRFYGYDAVAYVYPCTLTGGWVVNASRYASCD